jgi:hypothetical protein
VSSKIQASVNAADLEVRHGVGGEISVQVNDKVKIYFGFYDQDKSQGPAYSLAFSGIVTKVKNGLEKSNISCKSAMKKIAKKKTKITFAKMMGMKDLLNKFAIDLGGLELSQSGIFDPGINKQPGYGISEQQPILEHVKRLSTYCAFDAYSDVFDKFHATPWDKSKLKDATTGEGPWLDARGSSESENDDLYKHKVAFDKNLLAIDFDITGDKYSGTEVVSFIPFSEDQAHTIDPIKVEYVSPTGDDGKPLNRYNVSHLVREDAEKIAENLFKHDSGKILGSIKLLSSPQIRVGDGIVFDGEDVEEIPFESIKFNTDGSGNKITDITFQVAEVQHKFDTVEGFVTNLKLIDLPASAGSLDAGVGTGTGAGAAGVGASGETEFTGTSASTTTQAGAVTGTEAGEEEEELVTIEGVLSDEDGNILKNINYRLETPDGETIEGVTNDDGEIRHDLMPKGSYRIHYKKNIVKNEDGEMVPVEDDDEEETMDINV